MPGWGPYVEETTYQDFIANYVDEPEVSDSCSFTFPNVTNFIYRSILASLNMMLLSGPKHGVPLAMLCQVPVLSSAQDMHLFAGMVPETFRKERSKDFQVIASLHN
jgi:hypothetical protein